MSDAKFEILAGLSGSGPPAIPFPATNRGFSEGFVVRFMPSSSDEWTGNFSCGETRYSNAHMHPDTRRIFVIAGGADYLINPNTKSIEQHTTQDVSFSCEIPELNVIVFGDYIHFWAEGKDGRKWTTPCLSWDGIKVMGVLDGVLTAMCYSVVDEKWHEIRVDLASGDVSGFSFASDGFKPL
jgi:hypothetical protein